MIGGIDWKMFLSPEMRAGVDVATGEKSIDEAALNYATGQAISGGVNSLGGTDALGNSQEKLFNEISKDPINPKHPVIYTDFIW